MDQLFLNGESKLAQGLGGRSVPKLWTECRVMYLLLGSLASWIGESCFDAGPIRPSRADSRAPQTNGTTSFVSLKRVGASLTKTAQVSGVTRSARQRSFRLHHAARSPGNSPSIRSDFQPLSPNVPLRRRRPLHRAGTPATDSSRSGSAAAAPRSAGCGSSLRRVSGGSDGSDDATIATHSSRPLSVGLSRLAHSLKLNRVDKVD